MPSNPLHTRLCEQYGCEVPVVAFAHTKDVIAAVTNAGGIGILGAAGSTAEELRSSINWIRERVGNKPFGVDLLVPASFVEGNREDLEAMIPQGHRDFVTNLQSQNNIPDPKSNDGRLGLGPELVRHARELLEVGEGSSSIARREGVRVNTVSTWRLRFAAKGLPGLQDESRAGRPTAYGPAAEERILTKLDEDPPDGYGSWNGSLLAKALDLPARQVWSMLRKHGIQLQRRRSWCISTDPEFAPKAAEIVALYLKPPENAIVLSVDEKPHIQALERDQGYLRLPDGKAVRGVSHEYKRHGTTTLFAALNVLTGTVHGMHTERRRREAHKPKHDAWLARHPNVHFHFTPTHASWLNQVEVWFSILSARP